MEPNEHFIQLCVWPGTLCGEKIEEFESFMMENFSVRIRYKCELNTNPDIDKEGNIVPNTGGRNDLFFYIHTEDIPIFAIKRLAYGIRWWEDVIKYNNNAHLYPTGFIEKNPPRW